MERNPRDLCKTNSNKLKFTFHTDTLGLHRVENPNPTEGAISLHLYCPPYDTCSIFNQKTGAQTKCRIDHYEK